MAGREESAGTLSVGVAARTKNFHKGMKKARGDLRGFAKDAKAAGRETNSAFSFGDKFRKQSTAISFGAQQAGAGLTQLTGAANLAGKASGALGGIMSGLFSGGLIGAGIGAVTSLFNIIAEESRKAEEQRAALEEKRRERQQRLAEEEVSRAQGVNDRLVDLARERGEREHSRHLDALERRAKANGSFFDRQLQDELHASRGRMKARQGEMRDQLQGIRRLQDAQREASGDEWRSLQRALDLRRQNVAALREAIEAERDRPQQARDDSSRRQTDKAAAEQRKVDKAAAEKETAATQAAAKAHGDKLVAMRQAVEKAVELANMTERERRNADKIRLIRQLDLAGRKDLADTMRKVLAFEEARDKHAKATAAHQAKQKQGAKLNLELAKREALAKATTELQKLQINQQAEYLRLVEQGASHQQALHTLHAERVKFLKGQKEAVNETAAGLRRQLEVMRAQGKEAKDAVLRQQQMNDVRKKGGEEAVRLQRELNRLVDEQAAKEKKAADAKKRDAGVGGARFDSEGNFQGLGLAAARQARRDALRSRKRRRAERGRMGRSIHDGRFSGLGGIRSGRRLDQQGPASSLLDPQGDREREEQKALNDKRKKAREDKARAAREARDGGPGEAPTAPSAPPKTVTGKPGGASDFRDGASSLEDAMKLHEETLKKAAEDMQKAAEKGKESAESAQELAEGTEKLVEAGEEQAAAIGEGADAVTGFGAKVVEVMKANATKTTQNTEKLARMEEAMAAIQAQLSGSG